MESLQNIPNLLEFCQNDLDLAIEAVNNLVKEVSNGNQKNHKSKLLAKMKEFTKVLLQNPPSQKRSNELPQEATIPKKKIKLHSKKC